MKSLMLFLLTFAALNAGAEDKKTDKKTEVLCEKALTGSVQHSEFKIIPSVRVPQHGKVYEEYVKELTEPGGVIEELGIPMTGQIVEFVQGKDLNALTSGTAGGYPVSFYLDGAAVLRALQPRGGYALEVVYPGPQFQHGFYRDDNGDADQKSIIDHVVGHNNFAFMSGLEHYRAGQGMLATRELDELLKSLYSGYHKEEVQRFYLWALTMSRMMDWYAPFYQTSKEFEASFGVQEDPLGRSRPTIKRHPRAPSENVLPAFAANIASHEPTWKRKILELLHTSMAFRPALVHTQIMNEGWASIMQEIIPAHTKNHKTFNFWLNASQVMQRENRPDLKDPYSLGVFCWRYLRQKFFARPEISQMKTLVEKDRAFIKWANDEIISKMTDEQFLRLAMDQDFVDNFKLAIVRRAEDPEVDPNLPPPQTQEPVAQWIIVSRQADKVVQAIIDEVIKPKYQWNPRVRLVDFNRPASGEVELKIDDAFGKSLAMERSTLTPSLYAMANIIGKPVSLECNLAFKEYVQEEIPDPWAHVRPYPLPPRYNMREVYKANPVRVVVAPNGEAKVFRRNPDGTETFDKDLTDEQVQNFLKPYIEDLFLDDNQGYAEFLAKNPEINKIVSQAVASMVDGVPYDSMVAQAANSAGAIIEYKDMVQKRLVRAMELAAQGKRKMQVVGGSMRIRALPQEVHLQFDMEHVNFLYADTKGARPDISVVNRTHRDNESIKIPFGDYQGGDGKVGGIDGNPGDKFWGPGNPQGGESGRKPGEDPNDLSWVEIPADLYSKFLGERVKLPILNRKPGMSRTKKMKPGRRINRRQGQALPTQIIENAYARGYVKEMTEGRDPSDDPDRTMDVGLESLLNRDWVVRSQVVTKKPDTRVVVTFVLDASGSTARYMEAFKRFVHDIETLIQANYQGFAFRYIIFDTQAHVLKDKKDFFRAELGGGTYYAAGIERAHKLFKDEYPRANWDRYTFLMGDMEDFDPDKAMAGIKGLLEDSEYFGVVAGLHSGEWADWLQLLKAVRSESSENPALGLTVLDDDGGYSIDNIREVLKNEDESK
jgi:spore cortex formation protein SpoVR/YcgB (stage V sporulation)